jgi:hypothetical protein
MTNNVVILREQYLSHPAGSELTTSVDIARDEYPSEYLWCYDGSALCIAHRIPVRLLLPIREYLRRRPHGVYYLLGFKNRVGSKNSYKFLCDPNAPDKTGAPFRFESEGEIRFYMKVNDFNFNRFFISKFIWTE